MSYTIAFDQVNEANEINKAVRRCRIGKVWPKRWQQPVIPAMPYVGDFPHYPPVVPTIWTPGTGTPPFTAPMPNTSSPPAWWQNPVVSTC
jgi:hypothetical protein